MLQQSNFPLRPPIISDHLLLETTSSKYQKFLSQITINRTSCNPPPLIQVTTSCKWPLLEMLVSKISHKQKLKTVSYDVKKVELAELFPKIALPHKFLLVSHFSKNFDSTIWSNQVSLMWIVPNTVLNNLLDNLLIKNHIVISYSDIYYR